MKKRPSLFTGPLAASRTLRGEALWRALGYTNAKAFQRATAAGKVSITLCPIPGQARGAYVLHADLPRMLKLLNWRAAAAVECRIEDLYVCPRIYPFMRRPPRPVPTQFVWHGKLDSSLRCRLGDGANPGE